MKRKKKAEKEEGDNKKVERKENARPFPHAESAPHNPISIMLKMVYSHIYQDLLRLSIPTEIKYTILRMSTFGLWVGRGVRSEHTWSSPHPLIYKPHQHIGVGEVPSMLPRSFTVSFTIRERN